MTKLNFFMKQKLTHRQRKQIVTKGERGWWRDKLGV